MNFIWQDDQLIYQNEQQEMLGNIGFKMINQDQTYVIERTWVAEAARGQGLAEKMTIFFLDHAKAEHKNILPLCSYTQKYFASHPELENLLFKQTK
ncbi:GNAT family N-acetyltransferase [Ligilactobacillus apodemi]|uniref:Acetyltransferase n=1 Tax=Ligilactobacillus apodemi DSM 16634 = JCM 16172 TaxID=1423724 RepID=A0A0R1U690_9LACO|nr:GNAT family N-acetyltransferase [Ligilactobacillus apodemi]KRL85355.1 acetyltransferase [Ligilactobacillus apodemi DSM 16634 = JCM 16172]MCR1902192.1 N-acetyltransferase [Ligilactobacillus apodemi]